jgi:hypothetical protein
MTLDSSTDCVVQSPKDEDHTHISCAFPGMIRRNVGSRAGMAQFRIGEGKYITLGKLVPYNAKSTNLPLSSCLH